MKLYYTLYNTIQISSNIINHYFLYKRIEYFSSKIFNNIKSSIYHTTLVQKNQLKRCLIYTYIESNGSEYLGNCRRYHIN